MFTRAGKEQRDIKRAERARLLSCFNVPQVCGYSLKPKYEKGEIFYNVGLSISKSGFTTDQIFKGEVDPEKYARSVGLPRNVRGIRVKYYFDEVTLGTWWESSYWQDMISRIRNEMPGSYAINDPYTTNSDILALRKQVSVIHGGCEIIAESSIPRLTFSATLGPIVWDKADGKPLLLSCAHVFDRGEFEKLSDNRVPIAEVGMPIYQPRPDRKVGEFLRGPSYAYGPNNNWTIDAAVATIDEGIDYNPYYFGPAAGSISPIPAVEPEEGDTLLLVGRSSGAKTSTVTAVDTIITWNGLSLPSFQFQPALANGDSGSTVFIYKDGSPKGIAGVNWGSSGFGAIGLGCSSLDIEEDLNIRFLPPTYGVLKKTIVSGLEINSKKVAHGTAHMNAVTTTALSPPKHTPSFTVKDENAVLLGVDGVIDNCNNEDFLNYEVIEGLEVKNHALVFGEGVTQVDEDFDAPKLFIGQKAARQLSTTANRAIYYNAAGNETEDQEIVAKLLVTNMLRARIYLRGSAGNNATCYFVEFTSTGGPILAGKFVNGSYTSLGMGYGNNAERGTWYWLRLRAIGTTIQIKGWTDGLPEPTDWMGTFTDTSLSSGFFAIGGRTHTGHYVYYDYVGMGVNGATAPLPDEEVGIDQYADDFSGATAGSGIPTGWTETWGTATWETMEDSELPFCPPLGWNAIWNADGPNYRARHQDNAGITFDASDYGLCAYPSSNGRAFLAWHTLGQFKDGRVLGRVRNTSTSNWQGRLHLRTSNHASTAHGYLAGLEGGNELVIHAYVNGTTYPVGSTAFNWSINTWYWILFEAEGTTLRAKAWAGAIDDEPAEWMIEETDTSVEEGFVGYGYFTSGTKFVDIVEVENYDGAFPGGSLEGTYIHTPKSLSDYGEIAPTLKIIWSADVPAGVNFTLETAITNSGTVLPAELDWEEQISGSVLTNDTSINLTDMFLWYRVSMDRTDASIGASLNYLLIYDVASSPPAYIVIYFNGQAQSTDSLGEATFLPVEAGEKPFSLDIVPLETVAPYPSTYEDTFILTATDTHKLVIISFTEAQKARMSGSTNINVLGRHISKATVQATAATLTKANTWFVWNSFWATERQISARVEIDFPAPLGTVIFEDEDIISMTLLEEASGDSRSPLGFVTANQISLSLANTNRRFTPSNPDRVYNVRPGLEIRPYILIQGPAIEPYAYPLGTFWCDDWDTPSDSMEASTIGHDRLMEMLNKDTPQIPVMLDTTIREMFGRLFRSLNLEIDEYIINPRLSQPVKVGWFPRTTVGQSLQLLAEAGNCFVTVNRHNQISVQPNFGIYLHRGEDFSDTNIGLEATYIGTPEGNIENAFDESLDSSYYPNSVECMVEIDFGLNEYRQLEKITMWGAADTTTARDFRFEGSIDKNLWIPLTENTLIPNDTQQEFIFENNNMFRYYRLSVFSNYLGNRTRIHDVRLYERVLEPPYLFTDEDMVNSINNPQRTTEIYTAAKVEYRIPFLKEASSELLRADKILIPSTVETGALELDRIDFRPEDVPVRQIKHIFLFTAENVGEIQELSLQNVTGGTFLLGNGTAWTGPIAYDASATVIQTALEGVYGDGNVEVSQAAIEVFNIEFPLSLGNSDLEADFSTLTDNEDAILVIVRPYKGLMTSQHINTSFGATDISLWIANEATAEQVDIQVTGIGTGYHSSHRIAIRQEAVDLYGYRELELANPLIQDQTVAEHYREDLLNFVSDPLATFFLDYRGHPGVLIGRPIRIMSTIDKVPEAIVVPRRIQLVYDGGLSSTIKARRAI